MKNIIALFVLTILAGSCKSQNTSTSEKKIQQQKGEKKEAPSIDEVFKMDANKDGLLDESEIKGPLQRDFSKIDSNKDGFISKEELENAPKPKRGQRPPRKN